MTIPLTRQDLQSMYLQFMVQKQEQLSKLVQDETEFIRTNILKLNNDGLKTYNITYASTFCDYVDEFIQLLLIKLKEIFIDSYITNEKRVVNDMDKIFIGIDWAI